MKYTDMLSRLMANRGINTMADAEIFLSPDYDKHTHDPFLMHDMERAVRRVYDAVKAGERIVIFSDYDADGIPGAVILHDLFNKIGFKNFENYIPHRHHEGFGLNNQAIDEFRERGTRLLITIDCGIADLGETTYAKDAGMDVIITDHHVPHADLPEAFAILNPKKTECAYPEKMLCGSGVIFKFVQAFLARHGREFLVKPGWEKWLLDMAGIATLSDMVPLVGENRVLAHYGLKVLKKTPRPGLCRLFSNLRVKREEITEDDVGFTLAPRINAASRMGEPKVAFDLLSTNDESLAGVSARALEHVNNERKGTVAALIKEMKKMLEERNISSKGIICLGNPSWRPSLLGLAANSLAESYGKPTFLWGRDGDGRIKGSARGGGHGDVLEIMKGADGVFSEYGGHRESGGFAVTDEAIFNLEGSLENSFGALAPVVKLSEKQADAEISMEDVSWDLYNDISLLSPFGTGNPKPVFIIKGARIEAISSFGREKNHTEIVFRDLLGRKISGIRFFYRSDSLPRHAIPDSSVNVVVHLEKSTYKRYPELRLRIIDIMEP